VEKLATEISDKPSEVIARLQLSDCGFDPLHIPSVTKVTRTSMRLCIA